MFTIVTAISADNKHDIFLFFTEEALIFHAYCLRDNLHEISKSIFWGKEEFIFQMIVCWYF